MPPQIVALVLELMPKLLDGDGPNVRRLRAQFEGATIREIDATGTGFYVHFDVPALFCLIVLSLLALAMPAGAQQGSGAVRLDSLIYSNPEPAPPYPFEARRDSLRAEFEAECDSALAAATEPTNWVPECHWPTYFYEPPFDARLADVAGDWTESQASLERELPPDFLAFVTVDIAWDGSVQEARLRAYRGDPSSVDIVGLVRRLRFDLSGHFGFPTLERASFGVPFRGRAADELR